MGEPRHRRAGFGDAAGTGLLLGRAHLPGFSGELRQRPLRELVAGGCLQERTWPLGNTYAEAVEAGLTSGQAVAKMPRRPQMKLSWASSPQLTSDFHQGDVT